MEILFSPEIKEQLKKLKRSDRKLFEQIKKQTVLFESNPHHPSLRTHKLEGGLKEVWSISIGRKWRFLYFLDADQAYFFLLGPHDEVYRH